MDATTQQILKEDITAFLTNLGGSSQEVYKRLKHMGVRGHRWSRRNCPVNNALKAKFGRRLCGQPIGSYVSACVVGDIFDTLFMVSNPPPVAQFIIDFDQLMYPVLINEATDIPATA